MKTADHSKTSECDEKYNCIAWIFGAQDRKWWPVDADEAYWPRELNNKLTILQEFILLLEDAGFEKCNDGNFESGKKKIAVYVDALSDLSHAAIFRTAGPYAGYWSSKIGGNIDIRHISYRDLEGPLYGSARLFFSKQVS